MRLTSVSPEQWITGRGCLWTQTPGLKTTATDIFIRGCLQEEVNDALLSNPTDETVLEQSARYMNRAIDRLDE
jgi:hypothetical protein